MRSQIGTKLLEVKLNETIGSDNKLLKKETTQNDQGRVCWVVYPSMIDFSAQII